MDTQHISHIKKLAKQWRSDLNKGYLLNNISTTCHASVEHLYTTDQTILNDVLIGRKQAASRFESEALMKQALQDSLYYHMQDIVQWIEDKPKQKFLNLSTDTYIDNNTDTYGEPLPIGHGFRMDFDGIQAYDTTAIKIVLQRNKYTDYGFSIVTCFPDLYYENKQPDKKKDLSLLIKQTTAYKYGNERARQSYLEMLPEKYTKTKTPSKQQRIQSIINAMEPESTDNIYSL